MARETAGSPAGGEAAQRWISWQDAGGALALVAALALWAVVLAGVVAPLGETLARLDRPAAPAAPPTCPVPPGALAAAPAPAPPGACP